MDLWWRTNFSCDDNFPTESNHFHLDCFNLQEKSELCPIFQSFRSPMVLDFPLGTSPFSKMDSMTWCAKLWTHSSPTSTKSSSTRAEVTSSGTQLLRQASKGMKSRSVFKRGGPQVFKSTRPSCPSIHFSEAALTFWRLANDVSWIASFAGEETQISSTRIFKYRQVCCEAYLFLDFFFAKNYVLKCIYIYLFICIFFCRH